MSPENPGRFNIILRHALAVVAAASIGFAVSGQVALEIPAGRGADILRARCLSCHEVDLIRQQRLGRAGWQRELDKMTRWGASLPTDEERNLLVDYLTVNFGVTSAGSAPAGGDARGTEIFARRCLTCHGVDLVEQQRLGPAGWTREVDKMIRWGAVVEAPEKDPLVAYLAGKFGPR